MLLPLKHIHDAAKIKRIVVSTYQAVSGTGIKAIEECRKQAFEVSQGKPVSQIDVYPYQIAFNAIPQIDDFTENGYTKEELKMVNETRKIMGDNSIRLTATAVRIPVIYGHSESVNIETEKKISAAEVKYLLKGKPGITIIDDISKKEYPMPINAAGHNDVFVGRIRDDESIENGINMWIVSDNIRKGAALNTIQIAELLIKRGII
jgi:aspartate-semialdehyde dehydrogenase